MAPSPPWRTTLLLLFLALLLLTMAHARAVRDHQVATSRGHAELRGNHTEVDSKEEKTGFKTNPCFAGEEDEAEECLMRRMLEAHTDYIYTQNGGHS